MIVDEFDFSWVNANSKYMVIGSKGSGRTTLIINIINKNKKLFGSTGKYITSLIEKNKILLNSKLYDNKDEQIFLDNPIVFMNMIENEAIKIMLLDDKINSFYICFDDVLFSNNWQHNSIMVELLNTGIRKISSIYCFDYVPKLTKK